MKSKKRRISIILLLILIILVTIIYIYNVNKDYIELTQLHDNSASQMMGYFIKTNNGKVIVVDGGTIYDSENLQNYINKNGGKVDYWFLTHFHTDHTGALADILNNTQIPIEKIIYHEVSREMVEQYEPSRLSQYDVIHGALQNERIQGKIIDPTIGQFFQISSNINMKIINIYENDITENFGNNTSTVYKLKINDKSVLFLGDTGVESSQKLLNNYKEDLKSDYVQMAHHGQNGATLELYKEINPTYCLWPTPAWLWDNNIGEGFNTGPFKTVETREWLKELNVKENYIEKDGDITLTIGK